MPNSKNIFQKRSEAKEEKYSLRAALGFSLKTADEKNRSVEFQLSSEDPVDMFDWERGEIFPEVLLTSGLVLPENKQVPLQDTHDRSTIKKTLGSVREIKTDSGVPVGRVFFARDQESQDAFGKVVDGHITDGSVGYKVVEAAYVERGQSLVYEGRTWTGPVKLATRWQLKEFSLAPVGADSKAKSRDKKCGVEAVIDEVVKKAMAEAVVIIDQPKVNHSADRAENISGGSYVMNKKLYTLLLSRGLAVGSTVEQALAFFETLADKDTLRAESEKPDAPQVDESAIRADADRAAVARISEITEACRAVGISDENAGKIAKEAKNMDDARAKIIESLRAGNVKIVSNSRVEMGETDNEKFRAAVIDGIMTRGKVKIDKPAPGYESFRGRSLLYIAETCLQREGVNTRNMSKAQIVYHSLRQRGAYPIVGTSADFVSILMDASNKSMQKGYMSGYQNWRKFCSIGNAPDFKTINRIQLFEAPTLKTIDEAGNYKEAKFLDGHESYSITSKGLRFTISRVAIINDDVDAFSRIPRLLGGSANLEIEMTAYGFLTGGLTTVTMRDAKALFHADHYNITTGSALSADAISADIAAMATQVGRGADGASIPCGAIPKYLHVPVALKYAAKTIVSAGTVATGGENVLKGELEVLDSPFLDIADTTKKRRYLTADPNLCDVFEISFLDGEEMPFMEEVDQTDADGRVFKVRLDVGGAPLDWRGALTNAGQ